MRSINRMSDEELETYLDDMRNRRDDILDFNKWFLGLDKVVKKEVTRKFEEEIGKDWRSYALIKTKKDDLSEKVEKIVGRTVEDLDKYIKNAREEVRGRIERNEEREEKEKVRAEMYEILDKFLEENEGYFDGRELGSIEFLIDDGVIQTKEELAEYGVEVDE